MDAVEDEFVVDVRAVRSCGGRAALATTGSAVSGRGHGGNGDHEE